MIEVTSRPKGKIRLTVKPGHEIAPTSIAYGDTLTDAFTIADLGSGPQITYLRIGPREWHFANAPAWRILVSDGVNNPKSNPIPPSILGAPTSSTITTSAWTIVWNHAQVGLVTWAGSLTSRGLEWTINATLQGAAAIVYRLYAVDSYFIPKPPVTANKAELYAAFSEIGGLTYPDATAALNAGIFPFDYRVCSVGHLYDGFDPDASARASGHLNMAVLYDRTEKIALMTSVSDVASGYPGVEYGWNGNGTNAIWYIRSHVADPANAVTYTMPYTCRMSLMKGGWYEAVEAYRALAIADAPTWLPASKVHNRAGYPSVIKNAKLMLVFNVGSGVNHAAGITACLQQVTRAVARYGTAIVVILQTWDNREESESTWPDYTIGASVLQLVSDLDALGVAVLPYTAFTAWNPDSTWYTSGFNVANGEPSTLRTLNVGGSPYELFSGETHYIPALHHTGARAHVAELFEEWADDIGPTKIDGAYVDAIAGPTAMDYRVTLDATQKGIGSGTLYAGAATMLAQMKTALTAAGAGTAIQLEYAGEWWMGHADLTQTFDWTASSISTSPTCVPMFQSAFGDYTRLSTYQCPALDAPGTADVLLTLGSELHRWFIAVCVSHGIIPTLQKVQTVGGDWFVSPGEDGYTTWQTQVEPILDMLDSIHDLQSQATYSLRKYLYGRRLKPLPGSWDLYNEEQTFTQIYLDFVTNLAFSGTAIPSGAWYSAETSTIGIVYVNFRNTDATVTLEMAKEDYLDLAGMTKLYQTSGNTRTLLAEFQRSVPATTLTIPAKSAVMLEITT